MPKRSLCKMPGCGNIGAFHGYCKNHFRDIFGITYDVYRKNRAFPREDPNIVAERIKQLNSTGSGEDKGLKTGAGAPDTATTVAFPREMWGQICELAEQQFRTPDQQVLYMVQDSLNGRRGGSYVKLEVSDDGLRQRMVHLINTDPAVRHAIKG